eukprot:PhM_4_TR10548/c0_g1_i1/m.6108
MFKFGRSKDSSSPNKTTAALRRSSGAIAAPKRIGGGKKAYTIRASAFEIDDRYDILRVVGYGAYGVVCTATDNATGQRVAIKKLGDVFNDITDARRMLREILILRYLDHRNVLKLKRIMIPREGRSSFNDLYLVAEAMDTDLHKVIRSPSQQLTEEHLQIILYQTLLVTRHCHRAGILHRDLKPANLLMNSQCEVKVCDFGLSRGGQPVEHEGLLALTDYVVTRWYRPPEVLLAGAYDHKMDMWSIGCIAAEIALRRTFLPGKDYLHQLELIGDVLGYPEDVSWVTNYDAKQYMKERHFKYRAREPTRPLKLALRGCSRSLLDLIGKMLVWDPTARLSAEEALQHPYISHLYVPDDDVDTSFEEPDWSFDVGKVSETRLREMFWEQVVHCGGENAAPLPTRATQVTTPSLTATSTPAADDSNIDMNVPAEETETEAVVGVPVAGGAAPEVEKEMALP